MMMVLLAGLLVGYVILAVVVARFCSINRDWEDAVDRMEEDLPFAGSGAENQRRRLGMVKA